MVVVIEVSLTEIPVIPPEPARPADAPVESATPCTFAFVASVTVPPSVVVPVPIAGRATVPVGGVIEKKLSKLPVAACPISHSSLLSAIAPVAVPPE